MKQLIFKLACAALVAAIAFGAMSLVEGLRLAAAAAVGLPSLVLLVVSRRQLGSSFAARAEARVLVTRGLYSRIRHPMYLFVDLVLVALTIASGWPLLLALWGVFVVVQTVRAGREDEVLAGAFGEEYRRYRARTWF